MAKAPENMLNLLATLVLEWPVVLAILPETVAGFTNLVRMTVHRVKTFTPDDLPRFLELCGRSVRDLVRANSLLSREFQLFDAGFTGGVPTSELTNLFGGDLSTDYLASCVIFGRFVRLNSASFLPPAVRSGIVAALRTPDDPPERPVRPHGVDLEAMFAITGLVHSHKVSEIHKHVKSPVV